MLILTDRTRIEADFTCRRKRYWLTEFEGRGIVPIEPALALQIGIVIHHGLQFLAQPEAITELDEFDSLSLDHQLMCRGLLYGFRTRIWPEWLKSYETVAIEAELEFESDGVMYMTRPDILLRHRETKQLWYPDFKTFSSWNNQKWPHALQQQLTMKACEHATGESIVGCWIQGLSKGYMSSGKLIHPLVYGYRRLGEPGVTKTAYSAKYKTGLERFRVDGYEEGQEGWIDQLPDEIISKLFPQTAPIMPKRAMLDTFLAQRNRREKEIKSSGDLDVIFEQNVFACQTAYGTCPYFDACWTGPIREDPVGSGMYVPREPHHRMEMEVQG